ncbi:MAG TPA: class I SAM-dependent methyltransferase [Methanoregulaceae archaeon]|nr:MAG: class I SAM-dependent methyltransferase [Methanolinea sp.]HON82186.1 class I SAM-dependent methyltransferase [Methanoregulaceae archaeon]HPD10928.1 class I SAM-dependent methyltransferase [Methanoregulaceae archaeon]HRT16072.1 class I SAM-dependent methyltransferase [Methanoregulaceae archaeon]HRU31578.1 class I SAM-dependent methyltransferase [Methanoregulaceae archaeon]
MPEKESCGSALVDEERAREFDEIATTVFAPIYPVLAGQVLERTGIREGIAVDAGCGPALLAIAIALQSRLRVYALDSSPPMLRVASGHIRSSGLVRQVVPVLGDVHELPFEDGTVDLVVSRGSWFFWNDLAGAFQEVQRVLSPRGYAYIGGGFGTVHLKEQVATAMKSRYPEWEEGVRERMRKNNPVRVREEFDKAGITAFRLIEDESGFWAMFRNEGSSLFFQDKS